MTRYALLVRGINVGGKNKVVMAQLRQELAELGLENVETYINAYLDFAAIYFSW